MTESYKSVKILPKAARFVALEDRSHKHITTESHTFVSDLKTG